MYPSLNGSGKKFDSPTYIHLGNSRVLEVKLKTILQLCASQTICKTSGGIPEKRGSAVGMNEKADSGVSYMSVLLSTRKEAMYASFSYGSEREYQELTLTLQFTVHICDNGHRCDSLIAVLKI